jgi:molecular chaperone GrpE
MNKESFLKEISNFLDENNVEAFPEEKIVDLFSLFTELIALKTEVKLSSRQTKRAIDDFKTMFDLLERDNTILHKQLNEMNIAKDELQKQALRPILNDLLDLKERLNNNIQAIIKQQNKPSFFGFNFSDTKFLASLTEGLAILERRIEQCLKANHVMAIKAIGEPLCPKYMRVHSTGCVANVGDGVVIEEYRKGFIWGEEILRLAEVKVNKKEVANG